MARQHAGGAQGHQTKRAKGEQEHAAQRRTHVDMPQPGQQRQRRRQHGAARRWRIGLVHFRA
jgi:hypothetical protein